MTHQEIINYYLEEMKALLQDDGEITIDFLSTAIFPSGLVLHNCARILSTWDGGIFYDAAKDFFYFSGPHPEYGGSSIEEFIIESNLLPETLVEELKSVARTSTPKTIFFDRDNDVPLLNY